MTIDEFLEELKKYPDKWELYNDITLRCNKQCPITFLYNKRYKANYTTGMWLSASIRLELSSADATSIVIASDCDFDPLGDHEYNIRKKLFEVLKPVPPTGGLFEI